MCAIGMVTWACRLLTSIAPRHHWACILSTSIAPRHHVCRWDPDGSLLYVLAAVLLILQ
jgi:hypothetical protein